MRKALLIILGCLLTAMVAANSYAAGAESNAKGGIAAFLPLLILLAITYWVLVKPLSKRKGRSHWLELLLFVPFANALYVLWLVSLTDKALIDGIKSLQEEIGRVKGRDSTILKTEMSN
jgi:uncharacterized membrane protein YhaH (DUF805 family)